VSWLLARQSLPDNSIMSSQILLRKTSRSMENVESCTLVLFNGLHVAPSQHLLSFTRSTFRQKTHAACFYMPATFCCPAHSVKSIKDNSKHRCQSGKTTQVLDLVLPDPPTDFHSLHHLYHQPATITQLNKLIYILFM